MARLLLLLSFLLIRFFSYSQRIDSLHTNEEVLAFVRSIDKTGGKFFISAPKPDWGYAYDSNGFRQHQVVPYQKADLDNNGTTDLLLNGFYDYYEGNSTCSRRSLAILSFGADSFRIKQLIPGDHDPIFFAARCISVNNEWCLEGFEIKYEKNGTTYESRLIESTDTLVYAFDEFIEAKPTKNYQIEQINYNFLPGMGAWPPYDLTIHGDTAYWSPEIDFDRDGNILPDSIFVTQLDPLTFSRIYGLLHHIDLSRVKDRYAVRWTCDATGHLSIQYDHGTKKEIIDYGLIGTHALAALQDIFRNLRATQHWTGAPN